MPTNETETTDDRIVYEIQRQMGLDPAINPADVNVTVVDGEVHLRGIVSSDAVKQKIQTYAQQTPGVERVADAIAVESRSSGT